MALDSMSTLLHLCAPHHPTLLHTTRCTDGFQSPGWPLLRSSSPQPGRLQPVPPAAWNTQLQADGSHGAALKTTSAVFGSDSPQSVNWLVWLLQSKTPPHGKLAQRDRGGEPSPTWQWDNITDLGFPAEQCLPPVVTNAAQWQLRALSPSGIRMPLPPQKGRGLVTSCWLVQLPSRESGLVPQEASNPSYSSAQHGCQRGNRLPRAPKGAGFCLPYGEHTQKQGP